MKNLIQNLVVSKNTPIFAEHSFLNGESARQHTARAFFMPMYMIFGFVPPCGALMRPLSLRWNATGKAKPFSFLPATLNNSVMHSTETKHTPVAQITILGFKFHRKNGITRAIIATSDGKLLTTVRKEA